MKQLILSLLVALSFTICNAQSKYDTSLYKQVTLIRIDKSMKVGNWLTVVSQDRKDTVYMAMRNVDRQTKDMLGSCVLLSLAQWNDLLKNKK